MISIVDYGMGNLRSLKGALDYLAVPSRVVGAAQEVLDGRAVILPGVGSFAAAMANLEQRGLRPALERAVALGMPVLGICLGMQLLAGTGDEDGPCAGLGFVPGAVKRIPARTDLKVPHVGFNTVHFSPSSRLFEGLGEGADFYFVHAYQLVDGRQEQVAARAEYGGPLVAAIEADNVFGTQFHPEKSQSNGLRLLMRFARLRG